MTENVIENLAQHGIYGGGNPWTLSKPDIKREDIPLASDSAAANCSWLSAGPTIGNATTKSSTTDGNTQKIKSGPKLKPIMSLQRMVPSPPKMAIFDGTYKFNPYRVQLNIIENRYD